MDISKLLEMWDGLIEHLIDKGQLPFVSGTDKRRTIETYCVALGEMFNLNKQSKIREDLLMALLGYAERSRQVEAQLPQLMQANAAEKARANATIESMQQVQATAADVALSLESFARNGMFCPACAKVMQDAASRLMRDSLAAYMRQAGDTISTYTVAVVFPPQ